MHQKALNEASAAAGLGSASGAPDDITYDADEGTVTFSYTDGPTMVWKSFEYDAAGLVISWSSDSGNLSDRLWTKPAKANTAHATVELVSAYKNDWGLFVVLDVAAKDRTIQPDCSPLLDDVKHRQREAADCAAPEKINKGNAAYVSFSFEGAEFGGTLRYQLMDTSYNGLGTVKLKIR